MSNVNITYETLYEILRNERNREDIQELSASFYEDLISYLRKNNKMLEEAMQTNSTEDEREDMLRQIKNIKQMIKEIYERREKKIINLALNKSRTKAESLERDTLLVQEIELYERMVELMNCFRGNILNRALKGKIPVAHDKTCAVDFEENETSNGFQIPASNPAVNATGSSSIGGIESPAGAVVAQETGNDARSYSDEVQTSQDSSLGSADKTYIEQDATKHQTEPEDSEEGSSTSSDSVPPDKKLLKFREQVPKFLGKELEVYGPFDADDVANLPRELANILIRKGKAEEIHE